MAVKKPFKPQNLRALLSFILVLIALGGGALFYFGLETVRTYAVSVNERLEDADASDTQVQQLQVLKSQLAQSESLIYKADRLFIGAETYQAQALLDIRNYSEQVDLPVASTSFDPPSEDGKHIVVIKLSNPTNYDKLIQFLTLVDGNLPKMQVTSIDLKHIPGSNADEVEVVDIKINISVR